MNRKSAVSPLPQVNQPRSMQTRRSAYLRWMLPALLCGILMIHAGPAPGSDLWPPQVTVDYFFPPSPIIQYGTPRLVYELRLLNYVPATYVLDSIEVQAGTRTFNFSSGQLKNMIRFFGGPAVAPDTRFEAGRGAVVFMMLNFKAMAEVPKQLQHTLHFSNPDGSKYVLEIDPLTVGHEAPVVVAAPLRGSDWIAGDSVHNAPDAAHRRAIIVMGGKPWLAQRYAIDWVRYKMVKGFATTWSGPENKNESYFCEGLPIYSVADGRVVDALDGIPENVPHSGKFAVGLNVVNAGGNHVVVDIGGGHYAFYAHMRPGTVAVKVGNQVKAGQVLGHVGNSGSSTEPHLHFHIVDHPSFLAGQGIPYEFAQFSASDSAELISKPHDEIVFRKIGPLKPFHNDYPANNAAVKFAD